MTLVRTTTHLPLRSRPASVRAGVDRSCFGSERVATTPNCSGLVECLDCADGRQPEMNRANGNLYSDTSRDIVAITYNPAGLPMRE